MAKKWLGYIKGINLGGWISQCEYKEEHYETFITEADIKQIAEWGLDHVRLPIDYEVIDGIEVNEEVSGICYVERCWQWCRKYNLNLILDLHKVPGFSFDEGYYNTLLHNQELEDRFIRIWETLAKRYGKYYRHMSFELLNESVDQDSTRWNLLIYRTIEAIRKYAPKIKIIVGGIQWNSAKTVCLLEHPYDENVVYNFHFYEPFLFTHQGADWIDYIPNEPREYPGDLKEYRKVSGRVGAFGLGLYASGLTEIGEKFLELIIEDAAEMADTHGVSLYCGEYGVICNAPGESTVRWYEQMHHVFEKYNIGRAAWNYKTLHFGISDQYEPEVQKGIIRNL